MKNKSIVIKIFAVGLLVLSIVFIFINSFQDVDASNQRSLALLEIINDYLSDLGIKNLSNIVIRKIAHYMEFFVLGVVSCVAIRMFVSKQKRIWVLIPLGIGLVVAITDEMFQFVSAGRTPRVLDVVIDFSGVLSAVLIYYVIIVVVKQIKRRKIDERK